MTVSTSLPRWGDLCTTDVAALDPGRTVAVLPVAATEQHGPHLPLSVDADLVEGVLAAAGPHLGGGWPLLVIIAWLKISHLQMDVYIVLPRFSCRSSRVIKERLYFSPKDQKR